MDTSKEDKILLAGVEDKFRQCSRQYRVTHTDFLDLRQRSMAEKLCRQLQGEGQDMRCVFSGGYCDAERTAAVFLPDYADEEEEIGEIFSVVRVRTAPRSKAAEAVRAGLVFVNSAQSEKIDMQVAEGDKLVLRGKGKAYLREIGSKTRKDRIYISIERYL